MQSILADIEQTLAQFHPDAQSEETGKVMEIGDRVSHIEGLRNLFCT